MRIKKIAESIGVIGKVLNSKSNSTQNTYSANYIENNIGKGIIQTITNDNGTALKFADGTMICCGKTKTTDIHSDYHGVIGKWVYPLPFISTPHVTACPVSWDTRMVAVKTAPHPDYCDLMTFGVFASNMSWYDNGYSVNCIAIGRWK